jgi:hypothetical protein
VTRRKPDILVSLVCKGCDRTGKLWLFGAPKKAKWCRCPKGRKPGPYIAAPGHITKITFTFAEKDQP